MQPGSPASSVSATPGRVGCGRTGASYSPWPLIHRPLLPTPGWWRGGCLPDPQTGELAWEGVVLALPQGLCLKALSFLFSGRRWLPSHRCEAEGGHPAALLAAVMEAEHGSKCLLWPGAQPAVTQVMAVMSVFWLCSPHWPHKCWDYEPEPSQTELTSFPLKPVCVSPCLEAHTPHTGTGPVGTASSLGHEQGRRKKMTPESFLKILHVLFSHPQRVVYPETKKIKINQNKLKGAGGKKPINDQAGRPAAHLHLRRSPETPTHRHKEKIRRGLGRASNQLCLHYESERGGRDMQLDGYIFI